MARNAKEKKAKLRRKVARRLAEAGPASDPAEQQLQFKNLKPQPCLGERAEDLAVFTKAIRENLADELRGQAECIVQSLELVQQCQDEQAATLLKNIPRSSPFSEWRLFVRGLIAFYERQSDVALESWKRLDGTRRPARIAATLWQADTGSPLQESSISRPKKLVHAAKSLLTRSVVLDAARQIASVRHRDPDTKISASQAAMLREFKETYQYIDNQFVTQFMQACVVLATNQDYSEIFEILRKTVPGPAHDPAWNLQSIYYLRDFVDTTVELNTACDRYVKNDLPRLTHLPSTVVAAITSYVRLIQAECLLSHSTPQMFSFLNLGPKIDFDTAEKLLQASIKSYSKNRRAHTTLIGMLIGQTESSFEPKKRNAKLERKILAAKLNLVTVFPDELELTLELIDHFFDEDQIESAQKLIDNLVEQRLDSPLAKALPWKVKLREAMHHSRRKADLASAQASLSATEPIWPSWLGRDWVPYLQGAIDYRAGNRSTLEATIENARAQKTSSDLTIDFMAFAALQQMNVAGAELKPFRELVDTHLRNIKQLQLNDLLQLASFLWDLRRTALCYKAYRLHASKIGKQLNSLLKTGSMAANNPNYLQACSWIASHRFWLHGFSQAPAWALQLSKTEPQAAAAVLEALMSATYGKNNIRRHRSTIELLQAAAQTEKDPFSRYRFATIAQKASGLLAEYTSDSQQSYGPSGEEEYDEDDEYSSDEQDEKPCNCPACRRRRARQRGKRASSQSKFPFDLDEEGLLEEVVAISEGEFSMEDVPPNLIATMLELGPELIMELVGFMDANTKDTGSLEFETDLTRFLLSKGASDQEVHKVVGTFKSFTESSIGRQTEHPFESTQP